MAAPKAAREDYERFVKTVSGLLGGETEVQEVHEAARAVWDALRTVPSNADPITARLSLSARLKPSRYSFL